MPRRHIGLSVFDAAIERMQGVFEAGHRVVVSFSGGKDSGACLEICRMARDLAGRHEPLDVVSRDEEIMFPGTYEYCDRVASLPDVAMHHFYACQPIINAFNRKMPYWWVFDPELSPSAWVREPPPYAQRIPEQNIDSMVIPARFPPPPGKRLIVVIGLRVSESKGRLFGLHSSGGHMTKPNRFGVAYCRPIYDWRDGDIWRAHQTMKWDYNSAYDTMHRMGMPRSQLRIAPPTMNVASVRSLGLAQSAWPRWFDRVAERCPGVRTAAQFGVRSVQPLRRLSETWEQCYQRTCIDEAPTWIRERAERVRDVYLRQHGRHSAGPLPEVTPCETCTTAIGSWKVLTELMYTGDPFCVRVHCVPMVEPEHFRPGAGTWGGKAAF